MAGAGRHEADEARKPLMSVDWQHAAGAKSAAWCTNSLDPPLGVVPVPLLARRCQDWEDIWW